MGMKPPTPVQYGGIANTVGGPKNVGHYDGIQNTVTNIHPTEDPTPANAGACTTTKGPVPHA